MRYIKRTYSHCKVEIAKDLKKRSKDSYIEELVHLSLCGNPSFCIIVVYRRPKRYNNVTRRFYRDQRDY
jgi:hypothetical protein